MAPAIITGCLRFVFAAPLPRESFRENRHIGRVMIATSDSQISVSHFVEALKQSKLIEPAKLNRVLKSVVLASNDDRTSRDVANQLVTAGLLTKWQASQLVKAKFRGFFLGKYVLRKPLGRGGMGVVYEAEHSVLGTLVAIKILPKTKKDVEKAVGRFLAEARAAAKLNHPHVVRVHDCDVIDDRRFMVMDLVDGSNLSELVKRNGPLSYRDAVGMLKQAAAGLAHAHEFGVTHRDVKPQNFLIDKQGKLKVSDLGLAKFDLDIGERHTNDGDQSMLGTVDYIAPEQAWDSRTVDRRADIYSLGCTLYFMIAGRPPFHQGSLAQRLAHHQTSHPTPLPELRADCPPAVWQLCQRMMAKKPHDRIQKMSDVEQACDQLLPRLQSIEKQSPEPVSDNGSGEAHALTETWGSGEMDLTMDGPLDGWEEGGSLPEFGGGSGESLQSPLGPSPLAGGSWAGQPTPGSSPSFSTQQQPAPAPQPTQESPLWTAAHTRIAVYIGSVCGMLLVIGVAIALAFSMSNSGSYKPPIKQLETDGGKVIIVNE